MDYVVGSVAALISGNVTPSRPKIVRRALTPTKHQLSPNVTPKSEFVEDRSIFLSPTQQKKKAVVKKSPKRIFQDPNLDGTEDSEGTSLASPKAEKVKKHLKEELDAEDMGKKKSLLSKSPSNKLDKSLDEVSPKKKAKKVDDSQVGNNNTPKKKKRGISESNVTESDSIGVASNNTKSESADTSNITESSVKTPRKKQHKSPAEIQTEATEVDPIGSPNKDTSSVKNNTSGNTTQPNNQESKKSKKRKKKNKKPQNVETKTPIENKENTQNETEPQKLNKKKKNRKNKAKQVRQKLITDDIPQETEQMDVENESESDSEEVKSRNIPNPNAITEKESDSEHDSDDEIESENEQENEKILADENEPQESSDEEEQEPSSKKKKLSNQNEKEVVSEEEIKRTLFVGNVPFSSKCKKEIKKIFSKYGQIATVRIRTIPVKDARVTPKLAIIKNELHPERTTVNVYVKYADSASVKKALAENNTVLNGNHLRVSPSDNTGVEHDSRCAVFVGNLPFAVEDETLRSKFENCGEITSVRIIRDKKTNAGKGFGYVNFASKDGVELALALSEEDLTIKNRILRVKRCTQQKPGGKPGGGGKWGNQAQSGGNRGNQVQSGENSDNQGQSGGFRGNQGQRGGFRGVQGQRGGFRGNQGQRGGFTGNQGQRGGFRGNQGQRGGFRGNQGQRGGFRGNQGQRGGFRGNQGQTGKWGGQGQDEGNRGGQGQGGKWGNQGPGKEEGAARRLMNKRKQQEGAGEGPPAKQQKNVNQPTKEKKPRKEFVGMTAEKKKKHKFDKGQKKKKALSEILTKKS